MQQHALFISAHGPIPSSCEVTFLILFINLFIFGSWILQTKDLNTASPFLSDYGLSEGLLSAISLSVSLKQRNWDHVFKTIQTQKAMNISRDD